MPFVPNPAGLDLLLRSPAGAVSQYIIHRGEEVEAAARRNASGEIVDIQSGDLLNGLGLTVTATPFGTGAEVGSDAIHRSYPYPRIVHRAGDEPGLWLKAAVREVFPRE